MAAIEKQDKIPNKGVQGTLHKVSGPLTPDVGHKYMKILTTCIYLGLAALSFGSNTVSRNVADIGEPIYVMVLVSVTTNDQGEISALIRNSDTDKTKFISNGETVSISGADYLITGIEEKIVYAKNTNTHRRIHITTGGCRIFSRGQYKKIDHNNIGQQAGPGYPPQSVGSPDP